MTGFENHSGKTWLPALNPGKGVERLRPEREDGYEGAVYRNTYCTYTHGSLLPKNPALADHLIALALKNKYADFESLEPLDDSIEQAARDTIIKRLTGTRF